MSNADTRPSSLPQTTIQQEVTTDCHSPTEVADTGTARTLGAREKMVGRVEILSTEFALGWAAVSLEGKFTYLFAMLGQRVIGASVARFGRPDLDRARTEGHLDAYAFAIVYDCPVSAKEMEDVQIFAAGSGTALPNADAVKLDRTPPLRLFLFGSPRSGTSEMGATLTSVLKLAWLGEGHAAPLFAEAANALQGDIHAANGLVRFMGKEHFRDIAICAAKQAYFFLHGSASFVDKTPGAAMINAAPFIHEVFPKSHFIFLWRNPVANVLSRIAKFGGSFEGHCRDWSASMEAWMRVRQGLPHYLEVRQEDMLLCPKGVAASVASYLGVSSNAQQISASLSAGARERTGAGLGKTSLTETGWDPQQIKIFSQVCLPTFEIFNEAAR